MKNILTLTLLLSILSYADRLAQSNTANSEAVSASHCSEQNINTEVNMKTHGYSHRDNRHPLYQAWADIKKRCYNKGNKAYKYYGGRGIIMCQEWINNSQRFVEWGLDNGWKKGLDIDRRNNESNYSPENCRFVSHIVNMQNSKRAKLNIEAIKVIKYLTNKGVPNIKLCNVYNISTATVSLIKNNKSWKNVTI